MKKVLATSALALALAGTGAAGLAATAGATTRTPASSTAPSTARHHGVLRHKLRRRLRREVVTVSATTIGIQPQALVTELRPGKSIADVAAEHNVSAQTVINALVSAIDARVQAAVTNGKITSARAQKIEARLPAFADRVVNHVFGQAANRALVPAAS